MSQFFVGMMEEPAEYKAISYVLFLFKIVCSFIKDKFALSCFALMKCVCLVIHLKDITLCVS